MNFQEFSFLNRKVELVKEEQELPNIGHAFGYCFLEEFYPDIDDIYDILTEGTNDLGIDAININDDSIDIFQFKYTPIFENKNKKVNQEDIDKIFHRLSQILNKDKEILNFANMSVSKKMNQIWQFMEKRTFKEINVYFVTNYDVPLDDNVLSTYKKSFKRSKAKFEIYDSKKIVELFSGTSTPAFDTSIKFSGKNYFERSDSKVSSLIGAVQALNLIESLVDEDDELSEDIFEENVRIYLKKKSRINQQIIESSKRDDNYKFFYFNNGITVICDKFDYLPNSDSPVVELKNLQIVNGSQTVHALYDTFMDPNFKDKLSNVYLLTRIYSVEDREIGQDIAKYTNTQNPVKNRDTRSNDDRQKMLEEELEIDGFYYQRKKNQQPRESFPKEKIIDSEKVGQVILAFYVGKPGDAKNKKTQVFDKDYEIIFDKDKINSKYVLLPYKIWQEIENSIKNIKKEKRNLLDENSSSKIEKFYKEKEYLLHTQYYTLMVCRFIAIRNRVKIEYSNLDKIKSYIKEANSLIYKIINQPQYIHRDPADIFKQNSLTEDIIKELGIIL